MCLLLPTSFTWHQIGGHREVVTSVYILIVTGQNENSSYELLSTLFINLCISFTLILILTGGQQGNFIFL